MEDYHVAVIPDGNRRWADEYGKPAVYGHKKGAENAEQLPDWIEDRPVDELTLWGLSVDNAHRRGDEEMQHLNTVFRKYADKLDQPDSRVHQDEVQVNVVGDTSFLQDETRAALAAVEDSTADYGEGTFNVALGYDGRWDIAQAADAAAEQYGAVTEENLEEHLALPEIDIVMGYGPDRAHLSHLANWQVGYATLYFPGKHWPEAEEADFDAAIRRHEDRSKTRGR